MTDALEITVGDPRDPQATALLQASHALMQSLFPAESNHYLGIEALCGPEITFLIARRGDTTLGCGAIANRGDYAEVKSMFTTPEARGQGVADALLQALEARARDAGLTAMKLETGDSLEAAHRLYHRHGFETCSAFGDYPDDDPLSVFMSKTLD